MSINFIKYDQFIQDIKDFSKILPTDYDFILGVSRSGMTPATIISLHFNIPLFSVNEFVINRGECLLKSDRSKRSLRKVNNKKILVIDDSINTGKSVQEQKEILKDFESLYDIDYAVIYGSTKSILQDFGIKYCFKLIDRPRIFEWNIFNSHYIEHSCVDIDGVLCKDPNFTEYSGDNRIVDHILNAKILHPITVKIDSIVTCRLEKYRKETEEWLNKNCFLFNYLYMINCKSPEERRKNINHGEYKAQIYIKTENKIFIESSVKQAKIIADISKKPVFCVDNMTMY